jgi:Na+/proline symporter
VTAGFLGAIMSSADTALMSAATILSVNVVSPLGRFSQPAKLILTRVALVGVGGAAWLLAGLQQGIIDSLLLAFTVFVGGLALPTLASFSPKHWKVTSNGAMWAVVCGGLAAVLGKVEDGLLLRRLLADQGDAFLSGALGPQYPSMLPVAVSFVVMIVVSRMESTDR